MAISPERIAALRASGTFDPKWYMSTFPDVRLTGMDPAEHYLRIGQRLGRRPRSVDGVAELPTKEGAGRLALGPGDRLEVSDIPGQQISSKKIDNEKLARNGYFLGRLTFKVPIDKLPDLDLVSREIVDGDNVQIMIGRRDNFVDHCNDLMKEFYGKRQILFLHAVLNVQIRRGMDSEKSFEMLSRIWVEKNEILLSELNSRWLISCCDSIMDFSGDVCERYMACLGSTFINTIKLYETERILSRGCFEDIEKLRNPMHLFDGLTSFSVGYGDMIKSLRTRTKDICHLNPKSIASRIMIELLNRADKNDTIYRRLAYVHKDHNSKWF